MANQTHPVIYKTGTKIGLFWLKTPKLLHSQAIEMKIHNWRHYDFLKDISASASLSTQINNSMLKQTQNIQGPWGGVSLGCLKLTPLDPWIFMQRH